MKYSTHKLYITLLLLLFFVCRGGAVAREYGLYFQAYSVSSDQRTTLFLNDDQPFSFQEDFTVAFQMKIRNRPNYGSILGLQSDDRQQDLYLALIGKDDQHLIPALIGKNGVIEIPTEVTCDEWFPVAMRIDRKRNLMNIRFDKKDTTFVSPLPDKERISVRLGKLAGYETDVVAMNIKDVTIGQDGEQTRHWKLEKHNADICYDEKQGAPARVVHPQWVLDQYTEWKEIYSGSTEERVSIAYNEQDDLFYVLYPQKVVTLNAATGGVEEVPVKGGYPAIGYHSHLVYDTLTHRLISYFPAEQRVSYFSFATGRWSLATGSTGMADDYNHAWAYNPSDSAYYFFGGYGFHQYHSRLYRLKVGGIRIEPVCYEPSIAPRFSSSATVIDNRLFVFGGRGNEQGRQELGTVFYGELYSVDLKSGKTQLHWRKETDRKNELTSSASSMFFDVADSSFYVVSLNAGISLWKVPLRGGDWQMAGKPISNNLIHQDYELNFYNAPARRKMYVVMNKIMSDGWNRFFIYSIDTPLLQEADTLQLPDGEDGKEPSGGWGGKTVVCMLGLCAVWYVGSRWMKKRRMPQEPVVDAKLEADKKEEINPQEEESKNVEQQCYFDRSRSSISLLGTFSVKGKEGKDLTAAFTPLLRNFLSLLILYTQKDAKGISVKTLNEILWMGKEESAVRNTRNVALSKLRALLSEVGEVSIVKEGDFFHIEYGEGVLVDYRTVDCYIRQSESVTDEKERKVMYAEILELLLCGPLLQDVRCDWLDDFKAAYSNISIDWLDNLLTIESEEGNASLILRIADTILLHDSLNERALAVKCRVLYTAGKKGLAKKVYDNFTKEYQKMLGEAYPIQLAELISKRQDV